MKILAFINNGGPYIFFFFHFCLRLKIFYEWLFLFKYVLIQLFVWIYLLFFLGAYSDPELFITHISLTQRKFFQKNVPLMPDAYLEKFYMVLV